MNSAHHRSDAEIGSFRQKALAVVSGKGGVGKTTTAVNLAIYSARRGLRTGLLDLDPLSDIATLLDIVKPESAVTGAVRTDGEPQSGEVHGKGLSGATVEIFKNLDLLFPAQKTDKRSVDRLFRLISTTYAREIAEKYDLIILDMPAGSDDAENLRYLPLVGKILLVTNPEPAAHVAAGDYLKKALSIAPELGAYLWHNRFSVVPGTGFDSRDVLGNYNRNTPEEDRIPDDMKRRVSDLAFVPHDQSLDLLKGRLDPVLLLQRNLLSVLRSMLETLIEERTAVLPFSGKIREILTYYFSRKDLEKNPEKALEELGAYLLDLVDTGFIHGDRSSLKNLSPFSSDERSLLLGFMESIIRDELRSRIVREIRILERQIKGRVEAGRTSVPAGTGEDIRALDRSIPELLMRLSGMKDISPPLRNFGGLVVFYFALYKLFQSPTVTGLIESFLPLRRDRKGNAVRDRNRQIRSIVEGSTEYRERFLALVKKLYPIVIRQVSTVLDTFRIRTLVFRGDDGAAGKAYLKLLSGFLHDAVNSGLGVIVGFDYRPAAAGFSRGAEKLLADLKAGSHGSDA